MNHLELYTANKIASLTRKREGEVKLGECVQTLASDNLQKELHKSKATFVLLGLPEAIGVRANYGRDGANSAWMPTLENLVNIQSTTLLTGHELVILGHIYFDDLLKKADQLTTTTKTGIQKLRDLCLEVDNRIIPVIEQIVAAKKIPLIIGGGHNNSYGNIKGSALGLKIAGKTKKTAINCINCDAHSDFRIMEGRHSGNGFRYAFNENYLYKYAIIGLHQNYNSKNNIQELNKNSERIYYNWFEDIFLKEQLSFKQAVIKGLKFCNSSFYGVELDMDTIEHLPASAKTPVGITPLQARQYVHWAAANKYAAYLHITEAAPSLATNTDDKTGKLIAYLLSDFMKSYINNNTIHKLK